MQLCTASLMLCVTTFAVSNVFADDVAISRYLTVPIKPLISQEYLLQQHLQIKFPQSVLTIRQAIDYVLQFSGYRLVANSQMSQQAIVMLDQSLPTIDDTLDPMTLEQILTTLAGDAFAILVDPVHRLIGFKLKSAYQQLYINNDTAQREINNE